MLLVDFDRANADTVFSVLVNFVVSVAVAAASARRRVNKLSERFNAGSFFTTLTSLSIAVSVDLTLTFIYELTKINKK